MWVKVCRGQSENLLTEATNSVDFFSIAGVFYGFWWSHSTFSFLLDPAVWKLDELLILTIGFWSLLVSTFSLAALKSVFCVSAGGHVVTDSQIAEIQANYVIMCQSLKQPPFKKNLNYPFKWETDLLQLLCFHYKRKPAFTLLRVRGKVLVTDNNVSRCHYDLSSPRCPNTAGIKTSRRKDGLCVWI